MPRPAAFLSVRHPESGWPDDAPPLEEFPLQERVLVVLAHQPWASASDIARRLDVSESDVHKALHQLEEEKEKKLIIGRELGVTRRAQRRYVLTREGVQHVTRPFRYKEVIRAALPLTWQMTEGGVIRLLLWLPMIESIYDVLPNLWTSGLARPFQLRSVYPDPSCSSLNQSQGEMRRWWRANGTAESFSRHGLDGFNGRTKPIFITPRMHIPPWL